MSGFRFGLISFHTGEMLTLGLDRVQRSDSRGSSIPEGNSGVFDSRRVCCYIRRVPPRGLIVPYHNDWTYVHATER